MDNEKDMNENNMNKMEAKARQNIMHGSIQLAINYLDLYLHCGIGDPTHAVSCWDMVKTAANAFDEITKAVIG